MMMTYEEWKLKKQTDKEVAEYLEIKRQAEFAKEQAKESVFTRPQESIVDADN